MERKTEGLQVMFDEVLQRNAQLQKDNEQLEVMQREMKHVLQDFQKKNTELRVLYWCKGQKKFKLRTRNKNWRKYVQWMQNEIQAMVSKKTLYAWIV